MTKIAIIGAGAAGCFCAANLVERKEDVEIDVFEALAKPLAKVALTGGGRCNLTNTFRDITSLQQAYPRGEKLMKRMMRLFSNDDVQEWFEAHGVELVTQSDQCVFPESQDAMQIVHTLLSMMQKGGVHLRLNSRVTAIRHNDDATYTITIGSQQFTGYDKVVVTTGGSPRESGLSFLAPLQLSTVSPVPSLFTFALEGKWMGDLMGIVVNNTTTSIPGTKFKAAGPLLITHWGMSGPAILKLSSHAARHLAECGYKSEVCVNWYGEAREDDVRAHIESLRSNNGQKQVSNVYPSHLTSRHWAFLLERSGITPTMRWAEVGKKQTNRLVNTLTADVYPIKGKGAYKEEFVTCGGVALSEINLNTLESKHHPGLYLAGEVLDVDAITGGFNLQAAWAMGWTISQHLSGGENE